MRSAIASQCFGVLAFLTLQNGLIFCYLKALRVSDVWIVIYLALPNLWLGVSGVPSAYLADRLGKKAVGTAGTLLQAAGYAVFILGGALAGPWREVSVFAGLTFYAIGVGMFTSSWYALLSPVVPERVRGRFFGRLRVAWQLTAIVFTIACVPFLAQDTPVGKLQFLLGIAGLGLLIRIFFYHRIPEMEKVEPNGDRFGVAFRNTIRVEGYVSFASYIFLLALFTAGCPAIFGLIEKNVLRLGDNQIVTMGFLYMIGATVGYGVVGKAIDRFGTKPVFLVGHFGYGAVLFLYLARTAFGPSPIFVVGLMRFCFGAVYAAISCAISTELLALIPPQNKSLSTTLCLTLFRLGGALSGLISAWALNLGFLRKEWTLLGAAMSNYDAILLVYGAMIVLLVVTLGLVPSVIGKARWIPRG